MSQNPTPWGEQCGIAFQAFVFEYMNIGVTGKSCLKSLPHPSPF